MAPTIRVTVMQSRGEHAAQYKHVVRAFLKVDKSFRGLTVTVDV
jgi:hypothetical protein